MDSLFRFTSVRPAETSPAKTVSIQGSTPFQTHVRESLPDSATPKEKWEFVRSEGAKYVHTDAGSKIVADIKSLVFHNQYKKLRCVLASSACKKNLKSVCSAVKDVFDQQPSELEANQQYIGDRSAVWDSLVLVFLVPRLHHYPFAALTEVAQTMDIISRAAAKDESLNDTSAVANALSATIILPEDLLPANPSRPHMAGIADLLVVKQHIQRYEPGEIVNIENILKGEAKKKSNKHAHTNERMIAVESTTTTDTMTELETRERFSLRREAENTVKEDINAKAGINVSARYGVAEFSANASLEYANSRSDSQNVATEYAKDITSRALTRVIESVRAQQATRILETFQEEQDHTFDNTKGSRNVIGIYQWVNKILKAQVFNYGKRLLLDLMIPEPAALLLDATNVSVQSDSLAPPAPFNIMPSDLEHKDPAKPNYYGNFLHLYAVEGVDPPPIENISLAKTFTLAKEDKATNKSADLNVPDGYEAFRVHVNAMYNYSDSRENGLIVFVADLKYEWKLQKLASPQITSDGQYVDLHTPCARNIGIAIECWSTTDYAVLVEIECRPTATALQEWQLKTHSSILAAYQQKLSDHQDDVVAHKMSQPLPRTLGSTNLEVNRVTERTELKRGAIQLLTQNDLMNFDAIQEDPGSSAGRFPRPDNSTASEHGGFARFFEQAFEWDQLQYIFYPYYWSRKSVWYDKVMRTNSDPLFAEFLRAGQARVVIPVRPSMEPAVWYYLMTGQTWMGGDPPLVTSPDYVSIAEEIKERAGAPGAEVPYGPSWDAIVPTTLMKLRSGDSIDTVKWDLTQPWDWTPVPEEDQGRDTPSSSPGGS